MGEWIKLLTKKNMTYILVYSLDIQIPPDNAFGP